MDKFWKIQQEQAEILHQAAEENARRTQEEADRLSGEHDGGAEQKSRSPTAPARRYGRAMVATGVQAPLFSTKARTTSRNRRVDESMWSHLESSAFSRDNCVRDQLDRMVSAPPLECRGDVVSRLKDSDDRWMKGTVSELVVHQCLLEVGRTDIEVEPATPDGKTDYRLSSIGLHLEVTRIGESGPDHGDRQRK